MTRLKSLLLAGTILPALALPPIAPSYAQMPPGAEHGPGGPGARGGAEGGARAPGGHSPGAPGGPAPGAGHPAGAAPRAEHGPGAAGGAARPERATPAREPAAERQPRPAPQERNAERPAPAPKAERAPVPSRAAPAEREAERPTAPGRTPADRTPADRTPADRTPGGRSPAEHAGKPGDRNPGRPASPPVERPAAAAPVTPNEAARPSAANPAGRGPSAGAPNGRPPAAGGPGTAQPNATPPGPPQQGRINDPSTPQGGGFRNGDNSRGDAYTGHGPDNRGPDNRGFDNRGDRRGDRDDRRGGGIGPGGAAAIGAAAGFAGGFLAGTAANNLDGIRRDRREVREGDRTFIREPGRTIVDEGGGRAFIVHDENDRFRELGYDVRRERRGDDYVDTINRPGGEQILTFTTQDGRMLRRVRRYRDGREVVLIDNSYDGGIRSYTDDVVALPPPRYDIPRERYIVDYAGADEGAIYDTLIAPPVAPPPRRYTLDQIRYSPDIRRYVRSVDINTINFDSGSWTVPAAATGKLRALGQAITRAVQQNPNSVFLVEGYTDATGNPNDNLSLSDRRAQSVAAILSKDFGVPPENLTTQGYGQQNLKVNTQGPSADNRRVVVQNITQLMADNGGNAPPPPR